MRKRRPIIVSPSGNLYGSEKVLLDFLATAEEDYEIYLPEGRLRRRIAGQLPQVRLRVFSRVQLLYPELFLRMIFRAGGFSTVMRAGISAVSDCSPGCCRTSASSCICALQRTAARPGCGIFRTMSL